MLEIKARIMSVKRLVIGDLLVESSAFRKKILERAVRRLTVFVEEGKESKRRNANDESVKKRV